jgi:hypothetical protein
MNRVTLRAAPLGNFSGLAVRRSGEHCIVAAVLPKFWRGEDRVDGCEGWGARWTGGTLTLCAYEGDCVTIELEPSHAAIGRAMLESLTIPPAELADRHGRHSPLFVLGASPRVAPTDCSSRSDTTSAVVDLFRLMLLAGLDPFDFAGGEIGALSIADPLLGILVRRLFLDRTERAIGHRRRGYVEHRSLLATIRGRPRGESLGAALEAGTASVECDYEEFVAGTPLLQIIATCLRSIARARAGVRPALAELEGRNRRDAARIRRVLGGVNCLPQRSALLAARRLTLGRLERAWLPAFELAEPILIDASVVPKRSGRSDRLLTTRLQCGADISLDLSVPTAIVWEGLLRRATGRVSEECKRSLCKPACEPPWGDESGRIFPDIAFDWAGQSVILDAKYKRFAGRPAVDDAYQMFAYSHLAQVSGKQPKCLVLGYVRTHEDERKQRYVRRPLLAASGRPELFVVPLPWPRRSELDAPAVYEQALAEELRRVLSSIAYPT